jgi:DNA-binding MarR family transcriptional regulator
MTPRPDTAVAFDALRRLVAALEASARRLEQRHGLTPAQHFVLEQLRDGPLPGINALAGRTGTTQATVSIVVGRLVRRRLMTRVRDVADRRRTVLALTPAGRRLFRGQEQTVQARLLEALHGLGPRRGRELARLLDAWVRRAGLGGEPARLFFEPTARSSASAR